MCWSSHLRVSARFFPNSLSVGDGMGLVEGDRHAVIVPFTVPGFVLSFGEANDAQGTRFWLGYITSPSNGPQFDLG